MAASNVHSIISDDDDNSSTDSARNRRYIAVTDTVDYIKTLKGYEILSELGEGSYGNVLLAYDPKTRSHKAMKVVNSEKASRLEIILWPMLRHENILTTEPPIKMNNNTTVFFSPIKMKGLDKIAGRKTFSAYPYCIQALSVWLREVLSGLKYLHSYSYCHLDLKSDNVLIGSDGRACICDFTFINFNQNLLSVSDIGLPPIYCPPEVFVEELCEVVRGAALDIWAFGMLAFEVFTRDYILRHVKRICEYVDVKNILVTALDIEPFKKQFDKVFPSNNFNYQRIQVLLEFIKLFLQENAQLRTSSASALSHPFFDWVKTFRIVMNDIIPYITTFIESESDVSDIEEIEVIAFKRRQTKNRGRKTNRGLLVASPSNTSTTVSPFETEFRSGKLGISKQSRAAPPIKPDLRSKPSTASITKPSIIPDVGIKPSNTSIKPDLGTKSSSTLITAPSIKPDVRSKPSTTPVTTPSSKPKIRSKPPPMTALHRTRSTTSITSSTGPSIKPKPRSKQSTNKPPE